MTSREELLKPVQSWAVTVSVNGDQILTIGHNHLSGIENVTDYADAIENCARNLFSFIAGREYSAAAQAALSVDNLHPMTSTLRKLEADLRACAVALGQGDELGAVLVGYADAAEAALTSTDSQTRAQAPWQPIETAPKDGTRFLATCQGDDPEDIGVVSIICRNDLGGAARNPKHHYETWVTEFGYPRPDPTHWMPLPAPPSPEPRLTEQELVNALNVLSPDGGKAKP